MYDLLFTNKSVKQTLVKNTIWLSVGEMVSRLSKFFLIMVAARILKPEGYGQFNYIVSFLAIFFEFSDMGLSDYFIKAYQNTETKVKIASSFILFKILLVLFVGIIAFSTGFFALQNVLFYPFLVIFVMTIVDKIKGSIIIFSTAEQEMQKQSGIFMVETVVTTVCGITVLILKKSLLLFCMAYLVGSTAALIVSLFLTRKKLSQLKWNLVSLKPVVVGSLPFMVISFANVALISSDTLMIGWLNGMEDVGYFSAGQRIFKLIMQNLEILLTVAYPVLCGLITRNESVTPLMRKVSSITLLITFPIMCIGIAGSDLIISLVFGNEYLAGKDVFCLFMLFIPIVAIYETFARYFLALNSKKTLIYIICASTILNVGLNIILIPKIGINGAVISSIFARGLVVVYMVVRQKMGEFLSLKVITKAAISAGLAGYICFFLKQSFLGIFGLGIAAVMYLVILYVIKEMNFVLWVSDILRVLKNRRCKES